MINKLITFLLLCTTANIYAQREKCSYGERGSLTATCENASIRFFKLTTYRFDMLDETLRCLNCNLETVEPNSFDISGNQIQTLDIRSCGIKVLKPSAFTGLVFMKNLYMQNNYIEELSATIFKAIKKVQILDIGYNKIKTISAYAFKEIGNLSSLNLEHNQIHSLDTLALFGLESLDNLNLQDNMLTSIGNLSMCSLPTLTVLNLAHNQINEVNMGDFGNMTSLRSLDLRNNRLQKIPKGTFHTLKSLLTLDLSKNNIVTVEPFAFENLFNLEVLRLGNNEISQLQRYGFFDLPQLRELHLNNNKMTVFKTGLFTGMANLGFVNVSCNQIVLFIGTGKMGLESVHTLDFSHNNMTDLDYKLVFLHMPHLIYFKLDHNPWACYLVEEIDKYTMHDNVKLTADGVLTNTSCVELRKSEVEAMASHEEELYGGISDEGFAHGKVVYPLMGLMFIMMCAMGFVIYRLTMEMRQNGNSFRTTSHANLMSNDILGEDR